MVRARQVTVEKNRAIHGYYEADIKHWRVVAGHPNYMISAFGEVRKRIDWKPIVGSTTSGGYRFFTSVDADSTHSYVYLHHAVAEAFLGPRPEGMQVCHNDGDRLNNAVRNIRYDTVRGNLRDKIRHGTHNRGEKSCRAQVSEAEAAMAYMSDKESNEVALDLGVKPGVVYKIRRQETWGWLTASLEPGQYSWKKRNDGTE